MGKFRNTSLVYGFIRNSNVSGSKYMVSLLNRVEIWNRVFQIYFCYWYNF